MPGHGSLGKMSGFAKARNQIPVFNLDPLSLFGSVCIRVKLNVIEINGAMIKALVHKCCPLLALD